MEWRNVTLTDRCTALRSLTPVFLSIAILAAATPVFASAVVTDTVSFDQEGVRTATPMGRTRRGPKAEASGLPALSIEDAVFSEGRFGCFIDYSIPIRLSEPSLQTVTVSYASSDGTATAGIDYVRVSGTVTFAPGQTLASFLLVILGDTLQEPDETLTVTLSNPVNAIIAAPTPT